MFAKLKSINTISWMSMDVIPTMLNVVVNSGLICDTQTSCRRHF